MSAKLYIVATPIGNLLDMGERAKEVLQKVDLIAAEDTRNTIKLLNHFNIKTKMTSYHEHNKKEKAKKLIEFIKEGKSVALVSDAGMPAISDPGEDLVKIAYENMVEVTVIPGPCAMVSALAISSLPSKRFCFESFLPSEKKERKIILNDLKEEIRTIILYEAPHRLLKTLEDLVDVLGASRKISVVKEISKKHESVYVNTLLNTINYYKENEHLVKGEFVLIVEGRKRSDIKQEDIKRWQDIDVLSHLNIYLSEGLDKKDAIKKVAKDRGLTRQEVYKFTI